MAIPKVTFMPFKSYPPEQRDLTSPLEPPIFLSTHKIAGTIEKGEKSPHGSSFNAMEKISEGNMNKVLGQEGTTLGLSDAHNEINARSLLMWMKYCYIVPCAMANVIFS